MISLASNRTLRSSQENSKARLILNEKTSLQTHKELLCTTFYNSWNHNSNGIILHRIPNNQPVANNKNNAVIPNFSPGIKNINNSIYNECSSHKKLNHCQVLHTST